MKISRRGFTGVFAGALGGWACSGPQPEEAPAETANRKRIPIAVETWCFKELLGEDPEGTLAQVGEMGYEAIELAHYYRWEKLTADRVRKAMDAAGLKCCSSHINLAALAEDQFAKTIEYHQSIGNSVLIIASLPHQETVAGWEEMARKVNGLAGQVAEHGMRLGYHNHPGDFEPIAGGVPWEVFFNNTDERVIHQLDVGNMPQAYQDPVKYLKMYPGRTQSIHVKDRSADHEPALVGDGVLPFKEIFEICETTGGTEWYIVEYEKKEEDPLTSVRLCLNNLKQLLA